MFNRYKTRPRCLSEVFGQLQGAADDLSLNLMNLTVCIWTYSLPSSFHDLDSDECSPLFRHKENDESSCFVGQAFSF